MMPKAPPGGENWTYTSSQEYCVKISLKSTQQLWNYATWQFSEGLFPSVASKHSSCTPSAMPPPDLADPIAALTAAIAKLLPNQPSILLVTPSFDWNTTEQYDDFQLFRKSVESWFTLQNIPAETPEDPTAEPNSTRLEYVLNFLGNTGRRKFDHWKPTGTADEIARKKKWASAFMDYLSSTMDHAVSQCCRIYQLEDVRIWPGESPDELVDHLQALADQCNFPTEDEKEQEHPVQIRKSPKWQGTSQEAASPRSDGNNIQDAWSVPHTHCHLRQPRGHGIEGTENSQCHTETKQTSSREKTSSRQCTLMWMLHKVSPSWQIIMPSKGWPLPRMWKIRTLEAQVPKWTKRTQGQGTQTPQPRRKTEKGQWSWNWWRPPLWWSWCCRSCSADTISQGTTNYQMYEEQCWS